MHTANFISAPQLIAKHSKDKILIGQAAVKLKDNSLIMIAPMGRAPADFQEREVKPEMPLIFRSQDDGKNWNYEKRLNIKWNIKGIICGGGASLKYLKDGRLAMLLHRQLKGFHGGGSPVFLTSSDHGKTWSEPILLSKKEDIFYLMNTRLVETSSGRLLVPVAMPSRNAEGYYEGIACDSGCFYSDDAGKSWKPSNKSGLARLPKDPRGMAEPAVVEISSGRLMMLCRTGKAYLYQSWSDNGGNSWSKAQKTTLLSPCSSFALSKLPDGRLIVLYNHAEPLEDAAFFPRNPLTYSISKDEGQSWQAPVIIDASGIEIGNNQLQHIYPSVCPLANELLLSYTTHPAPPDGRFDPDVYKKITGGLKTAIIRI
jgi:hypothetical protein